MNATGTTAESASMAWRILTAMRDGDLAGLETGLAHAEQAAARCQQQGSDALEQLELLSAVAVKMRQSISRFGRHVTPHIEGAEVHIGLLRHLAREPVPAVTRHSCN